MSDDFALKWDEYKDDKNFPNTIASANDGDFEFSKTHPDWGMDESVKEYFRKA